MTSPPTITSAATAGDDAALAGVLRRRLYSPPPGPEFNHVALRLVRPGVPEEYALWGHMTLASLGYRSRQGLDLPVEHARAAFSLASNMFQGERLRQRETRSEKDVSVDGTLLVQATCLLADLLRLGQADSEARKQLEYAKRIADGNRELEGWVTLHEGRCQLVRSQPDLASSWFESAWKALLTSSGAEPSWVAYTWAHRILGLLISSRSGYERIIGQLNELRRFMHDHEVQHNDVSGMIEIVDEMLAGPSDNPLISAIELGPFGHYTMALRRLALI